MDPRNTNRDGTPAAGRSGKHRLRSAFSRAFHVYRRLWFRVLAVGFLFIALLEVSILAFPNPNLVPAIIMYCAFPVPVTFMVHLDDRLEATQMPVAIIVIIFISSGAVSLAFASTLELALFPRSASYGTYSSDRSRRRPRSSCPWPFSSSAPTAPWG